MPSNPRVTVVIPTYNHASFLGKALDSVCRQTLSDWEAIVVNNFSDDNTEEVVASFSDPRIRLVNFRNNGIIAASRNHGISMARGDCVAFLDSDDIWYPEKLEHCLAALDSSGADAICHGERWGGADGHSREVRYGPEARASYRDLLFQGNCISTSATVVRRDRLLAAGGFCEDAEIISAEDYDLWLKLAKDGVHFTFLPEMLGEYRLHQGGVSQGQARAILKNVGATVAVVERHYASLPGKGLKEKMLFRRAVAKVCFSGGLRLHEQGNHIEAMKLYMRYIHLLPFVMLSYGFNPLINRLWH